MTDYLTLTDAERRWLAYKSTCEEFDEGITVGRTDPVDDNIWMTTVESLVGFVDIAIDTDKYMIEKENGPEFMIYTGDRLSRYNPLPEPGTDTIAVHSDVEMSN